MTDKPKIPEVASTVAGALVAGATAGITLPPLSAAGLAVAPALIEELTALAIAKYRERLDEKTGHWFQLVADLLELGSPEGAAEAIKDKMDEPWAHKSVVEGVRAILNDIDDVALPSLAKIVAKRLKSKTPPDRRDKRTIQLLCECEPDSYAALRQIVRLCVDSGVEGSLLLTVKKLKDEPEDVLLVRRPAKDYDESIVARTRPPEAWGRAFFLIKKFELGLEGRSGAWGSEAGPHVLHVSRGDATYLAARLEPG